MNIFFSREKYELIDDEICHVEVSESNYGKIISENGDICPYWTSELGNLVEEVYPHCPARFKWHYIKKKDSQRPSGPTFQAHATCVDKGNIKELKRVYKFLIKICLSMSSSVLHRGYGYF